MNQPFSKFLGTLSTPGTIATILMQIKGVKVAARLIKGLLQDQSKDQTTIQHLIPQIESNVQFAPFMGIYKNSAYYGCPAYFANAILKYL